MSKDAYVKQFVDNVLLPAVLGAPSSLSHDGASVKSVGVNRDTAEGSDIIENEEQEVDNCGISRARLKRATKFVAHSCGVAGRCSLSLPQPQPQPQLTKRQKLSES